MNKRKIAATIMIGIIFAISGSTLASNKNVGTTGFSFLKLGVGAKAIAMGGAYSAVADDPSIIYYNPAGTINLKGKQFMAGYHNYVLDIQSGFVAGTIPIPLFKKCRAGLFIDYLNFGDFVRTDASGAIDQSDPSFSGGDFLIGANFSAEVIYSISAGINVKFSTESADSNSAEAFAVDIGFYYRLPDSITSVALSAYNLGTVLSGFTGDIHKDKLPSGVRAGAAHSLRGLPLVVAVDGVIPNDNDPYLNFGMEMYELEPLLLRLGYSTFGQNYKTGSGSNAFGGIAFGFGINFKNYQISYAFMPYLDLGNSHRVTVYGGF